MNEVNSNEKILKMLSESSHSYMEMYERIADVWADLKSIQTDWNDHIMNTGDRTALGCYLDLCHVLYELSEVRNHIEGSYEASLDEYVAVGNE